MCVRAGMLCVHLKMTSAGEAGRCYFGDSRGIVIMSSSESEFVS